MAEGILALIPIQLLANVQEELKRNVDYVMVKGRSSLQKAFHLEWRNGALNAGNEYLQTIITRLALAVKGRVNGKELVELFSS